MDEPWYLLPRDEDAENAHHATADFINMETVYRALRTPQPLNPNPNSEMRTPDPESPILNATPSKKFIR